MVNPQAYYFNHYLNGSLLEIPSFPVKKLHHKTLSHLFSEWMTLVATKDNMHAIIKPPNNFWYMMYRDYIKFPTFTKCQMTHKKSVWYSKECSKQQKTESVPKNSSSVTNFLDHLNISDFFADFFAYRGRKYAAYVICSWF